MKKRIFLLVLAMILIVTSLASVVGATEGEAEAVTECSGPQSVNIANTASITTTTGCWVHKSHLGKLVDGDRGTGAGSSHNDRAFSTYLTFDEAITFDKICFVVNSTANDGTSVSGDGTLTTNASGKNQDFGFTVVFYDQGDNRAFQQNYNTKDQTVIEIVPTTPVYKIEYYDVCGWNNGHVLWEIETYTTVINHAWVEQSKTNPTCTTSGEVNYSCSCGETKTEEISSLGHTPADEGVVTEPTCTEAGYTTYTCSTCGESYKDNEIPAAHKWGETLTAVYGSEPTCVAPGKGVYYCDVCWAESEQYDMPIDPKGHAFESITFNSAYTFATCADCESYYFVGENKGIDTEYIIYISEGRVNIYTEDWSFDEYYGYTEVSVVDGVYTFTLTEDADTPSETFLGATLVISINENESLYLTLTSGETVYHFGKDPNAKEDLSALLNGTYQYVEGDVVIFEFVLENGTITWTISGGEENGTTANYTYDGTTFECDFNVSLNDEGYLVYSAFHPINGEVQYVLTKYVEEEPEIPEEPEVNYGDKIGSIDVTTTDTYGWFDLYEYTAENAGKYAFKIPAGLGFYSKAQYDAYGAAELDYNFEPEGGYVVVDLEAGATIAFYVGAFTKSDWTIDVYYAEPEAEVTYEDEFNGTFANGADLIFVFDNGTLTVTDNTGFFNVGGTYTYGYNAELGEFKLDTDAFTLNVSSGTLFLNGRVPLTVYVPETVTELVLGDNSFTLENVNYRYGEVKVVFKATKSGTYIITASETGLVIVEGEYGAEMVDLPYSVTLAEGEEFSFIVSSGANVLQTTEDTVVITVAEKPAHECVFDTLVSIEYANGYLAEGVKTYACECNETKEEVAPVIFTFSGYSVKEDGTAMCVGYTVNRDALVAYETANETTVKFGVVNAGYDNLVNADGKPVNADGTAAEVSKGLVAIKAVEETAYTSFEIKMVSANWAAIADVNVILCAYVIEGEKVSYICGDTASEAAVAVTYNGIVGGNA